MYIVIIILCIAIIIMAAVLYGYKRQIKNICRQLSFLKANDSNMLITVDSRTGGFKELESELNDMLLKERSEQAEYVRKEKVIADTYTNLSHDIRTPLTSLDGYVQLLEEGGSDEERKKYIGIIEERIDSLKDMLEELFLFTKLKSDSYKPELSPCCVNTILKKTIFSYYDEWRMRGIEPQIDIDDKLCHIQGNVQALRRLIQNVIKNGIDHGIGHIRISLTSDEDSVCILVSNEVAEPESIDIEQVFDRFYKADAARSRTSSGLGLSIARELAARMNGEMYAELSGNEFRIRTVFPILRK